MSLIHEITTQKGFIVRYLMHLQHCKTQIEAYETTENEHIILLNRRKYKDYNSFRQIKNRLRKVN